MEKLSVVIITYNEEKNIARCIASVQTTADEIIVIDSFSTDKTVEIARDLGAKVHQQVFSGYGIQKNAGSALASHSLVLFLDADEALSESLQGEIRKQKGDRANYDGYTMNRMTNYCNQWIRHGSWYPDKKLRLVNREKASWNHHMVHESLTIHGDFQIQHLKGDLLHYSYASIREHVYKNNKYSDLSAQFLFQNGKRTSWFNILFNPVWAFFNDYIVRFGFLDGFNGLVIAINIAHLTFLKHVKLYELHALEKGNH